MDTNKLIQIAVARADIALVSAWQIIKTAFHVLTVAVVMACLMRRWR